LRTFKGKFRLTQINPMDGSVLEKSLLINSGKVIPFKSTSGDVVLWLMKY
jgi:hypothetical protein